MYYNATGNTRSGANLNKISKVIARAKRLKTNCIKALEVLKQTKIQTIIF